MSDVSEKSKLRPRGRGEGEGEGEDGQEQSPPYLVPDANAIAFQKG